MPFICNICAEESVRICARCTKDTCNNHLCEKCLRCSDCCECEVMLAEPARQMVHPPARAMGVHLEEDEGEAAAPVELREPDEEPNPEPDPEHPEPEPLPPAPTQFGFPPTGEFPSGQ